MKKAIKDYLAKLHDNKKDKGFSLVELIIVIAIMAILVGVVASQVLPYIEKSRKAKDLEVLNDVGTNIVTAMADVMAKGVTAKSFTITVKSTGPDVDPVVPATGVTDFGAATLYAYEDTKGNSNVTAKANCKNLIAALGKLKSDDKSQYIIKFEESTGDLTVQGGTNNDPALLAKSSLK